MTSSILYIFRKYPLVRAAVLLVFCIIVFALLFITTIESKKPPVITSIEPQIGMPGDVMTINGSGFSDTRDTNYVEIGGSQITASSYLSWTDTQIKLLLPANIPGGLVYVITKEGQSDPAIFANTENIPVAVRQEPRIATPVISSTSPKTISVGQILTISGNNFGNLKNDSSVYFTPKWMEGKNSPQDLNSTEIDYISAFENDFDYEYWSNTEIRVRIPDGAASGYFFVRTDKGDSNRQSVTITTPPGTKKFSNRRTYLIQTSVDITDIQASTDELITLRVPRPQPSATQPVIQMTECSPEPTFEDYNKSVIHHIQTTPLQPDEKIILSQNFVIPVFAVSTTITPGKIVQLSEKNRLLYAVYTSSDAAIPSDTPEIQTLSKDITGSETNPYKKALLLYNYILDNFTLLQEIQPANIQPVNMLTSLQGDCYDFAIIYCALARAAGIPAIPISGILADSQKGSRTHWWCEIYFENFGWFPVDPSAGSGIEFDFFQKQEDPRAFYFGNMDSQHIAFSRGWNEIKPTIINNKTVYRPKAYALQSIWEESTSGTTGYSSFWSDPVVLGIY